MSIEGAGEAERVRLRSPLSGSLDLRRSTNGDLKLNSILKTFEEMASDFCYDGL